jgi:hypothetical protein
MKVLFLNHKSIKCGVYQYGKRVYDIIKNTKNINYIYFEIQNLQEYNDILNTNLDMDYIIYNYHTATMHWLNNNNISKTHKNICIQHDLDEYDFFDIILRLDITLTECPPIKYNIPRPIYENVNEITKNYLSTNNNFNNFLNYKESNVITIGSFGFGSNHKGFDKIIELVSNQYDNAIIKLLIPLSDFGPKEYEINHILNLCKSKLTKPGIKVLTFHEFITNTELLMFLNNNDINLFLYDSIVSHNCGLSSVIDYAISVDKPFGISNSNMFRHIYNSEIDVYKNSINNIINLSNFYNKKFQKEYSNENLINKIKNVLYKNICAIIPICGQANRINNIPKFLLPCKNKTLLNNIIDILYINNITNILCGVSKLNYELLENNNKINKFIYSTKTMCETVYNLITTTKINKKYLLFMPDTYFEINNEINEMIEKLNTFDLVVLLWEIKDYQIGNVGQINIINNEIVDIKDKDNSCKYKYFWGSIGWNSNINKYINPEWETIGYLIKKCIELNIKISYVICNKNYYDCGTFKEYVKMINDESNLNN